METDTKKTRTTMNTIFCHVFKAISSFLNGTVNSISSKGKKEKYKSIKTDLLLQADSFFLFQINKLKAFRKRLRNIRALLCVGALYDAARFVQVAKAESADAFSEKSSSTISATVAA